MDITGRRKGEDVEGEASLSQVAFTPQYTFSSVQIEGENFHAGPRVNYSFAAWEPESGNEYEYVNGGDCTPSGTDVEDDSSRRFGLSEGDSATIFSSAPSMGLDGRRDNIGGGRRDAYAGVSPGSDRPLSEPSLEYGGSPVSYGTTPSSGPVSSPTVVSINTALSDGPQHSSKRVTVGKQSRRSPEARFAVSGDFLDSIGTPVLVGLLVAPYVFAKTGWAAATVLLVYFALLQMLSHFVFIFFADRYLPECPSTQKMVRIGMGPHAGQVYQTCIALCLLGTCMVLLVLCGDAGSSLVNGILHRVTGTNECGDAVSLSTTDVESAGEPGFETAWYASQRLVTAVLGALAFPLLWLKRVYYHSIVSLCCLFFLLYIFVSIVLFALVGTCWSHGSVRETPSLLHDPDEAWSGMYLLNVRPEFLLALPLLSYGFKFTLIGPSSPIYRDGNRLTGVIHCSLVISGITVVYFLAGFFGFATFSADVTVNVLDSYGSSGNVLFSVYVVGLVGALFYFLSNFIVLRNYLHAYFHHVLVGLNAGYFKERGRLVFHVTTVLTFSLSLFCAVAIPTIGVFLNVLGGVVVLVITLVAPATLLLYMGSDIEKFPPGLRCRLRITACFVLFCSVCIAVLGFGYSFLHDIDTLMDL
mmetsp:Transcript_14282/g.40558  ORF Transcript_14282/g.40558 Transcript_14282/m.40558 type:complete len:641 (+) Transcript_14282:213-2135(+)